MNTDTVFALNTRSGRTGWTSRSTFEHPVLNPDVLVEVEPGRKPYESALYRPRSASDFLVEQAAKTARLTEPHPDPADADPEEDDTATDSKDTE